VDMSFDIVVLAVSFVPIVTSVSVSLIVNNAVDELVVSFVVVFSYTHGYSFEMVGKLNKV
jgi:hypothetical protein